MASRLSLWSQWAAAGRSCTNARDAVKPSGWNGTVQEGEIAYLGVAKGDRKQRVSKQHSGWAAHHLQSLQNGQQRLYIQQNKLQVVVNGLHSQKTTDDCCTDAPKITT